MPIEIIVPRLGWSMEEGGFVAWLKKDGEQVRAGEPLFSIEGDKAVQEIESIDAGVLRIKPNGPQPGDPVRVGDVLGHLVANSTEQAHPPESTFVSRPGPPSLPQPATVAAVTPVSSVAPSLPSAPMHVAAPTVGHAGNPLTISPRALRRSMELGIDWTALRGSGRTGRIREQDVLAASKRAPFPTNTPVA